MMLVSKNDLCSLCETVLNRYFFDVVYVEQGNQATDEDVGRCLNSFVIDNNSDYVDAISPRNIIVNCMQYIAKMENVQPPPENLIDMLNEDFAQHIAPGVLFTKFVET